MRPVNARPVLLALAASFAWGTACTPLAPADDGGCRDPELGTVVEVVDGDTVDVALAGGVERLRLLGIDTPETFHGDTAVCPGPGEGACCYGDEAAAWLREQLPEGWEVAASFDIDCTDQYGRSLAYLHVVDDRAASRRVDGHPQHVNLDALRTGNARVYTADIANALSIRYYNTFRLAEADAAEAGEGLWSVCE